MNSPESCGVTGYRGSTGDGGVTAQYLLPPAGEMYTAIESNSDGYHAVAILTLEPSSLALPDLGELAIFRRRRRDG